MVVTKLCEHCSQTHDFTWHGPNCMPAWIYWAKHQVPPHANQHTVTALVGEPGTGKSGGGLCIFPELQAAPFDVREQVYFRPSDRIHVARRLGKSTVVYGDESSGEGGHKRRAMSKHNVNNVMDLDVMRQRNQHTVFTSPEFTHLDPAIQEACQWIHEFHHDRTVKSYEVIHVGKPDNRFHNLKLRFETPSFPHAQVLFPERWGVLMEMKDSYLAGRDTKEQAKARAFEDRAAAIMANLARAHQSSESIRSE